MIHINSYRRKPHPLRLCNPYRGIYRAKRGLIVRPWLPGQGKVYLGTAATLREAQQRRDEFLREKGLK